MGVPARNNLLIGPITVINPIGLAGDLVSEIENAASLAAANWGPYIIGATPLHSSLSFVHPGDFGQRTCLGSPSGLIANGQTVDGHSIFIPDSLYTLETGNYATGVADDHSITVVASATNPNNFYFDEDSAAGKGNVLSVLTHEIGTVWGYRTGRRRRRGRRRFQTARTKQFWTVSFKTRPSTARSLRPFDGPNAEAAYAAAIGAGGSSPCAVVCRHQRVDRRPTLGGECAADLHRGGRFRA